MLRNTPDVNLTIEQIRIKNEFKLNNTNEPDVLESFAVMMS
ncbi:hypothetical protein [Mycoplasmopsis felis]|nr:hypothetical protein [Mycoplasmopsis felis]WQQ04497.1 hypothetical protein RRG55_02860 [Mycoplasmopsis felis]